MATLKDYRDERLRKLKELRDLGINPYPAESQRTHKNSQIVSEFAKLEGQTASVAGRIVSIRTFGQIAFLVIKDDSGELQLFFRQGETSEFDVSKNQLGMDQFNLLDTGDFVQATGEIIKTQTGEISIDVKSLRLLTKALRPLPSKIDGFKNKEERLRRRYIDLNANEEVRQRFIRRSKFWQATRDFLNKDGFIEINVPVLEHTTGGADANPFVTHMDALGQDFYLRISHELPLKRLIGGGYEKVYDIGPRFRNENYSDEHLPEHMAMEWYAAYWNWRDGMKFMTDMYRYVIKETFGTLKFKIGELEINLSKNWEELDYSELIKRHYGLDVYNCTLDEVKKALKDHKLEVEKTENKARGIDKLWKNIRKDIAGPAWLINTPLFISPLAKQNLDDPNSVQRFQPIVGGSEVGNGFSELNDPVDQLERFLEQQKMRDDGDNEAMMLDIDYVEMLEYGMPPACGWGYSERVFWIFEGVTAREGVIFPQLKSEVDQVTRGIYPQVFGEKARVSTNDLLGASRKQDFSHRIVAVVNKELEPWQVANAVAHMTAIIGNEISKDKLTSGDHFVSKDNIAVPRNSQYAIIVSKASEKELHKLYEKVCTENLPHHVFIKEMQDTTNDKEIIDMLQNQTIDDTTFFGVSFFATNDTADKLTKEFQLWK